MRTHGRTDATFDSETGSIWCDAHGRTHAPQRQTRLQHAHLDFIYIIHYDIASYTSNNPPRLVTLTGRRVAAVAAARSTQPPASTPRITSLATMTPRSLLAVIVCILAGGAAIGRPGPTGAQAAIVAPPWSNPSNNPCASMPGGWQLLYWAPLQKCFKIFTVSASKHHFERPDVQTDRVACVRKATRVRRRWS